MTSTVKCLSKDIKDYIVSDYRNKVSVTKIADEWCTSTRTIGRVLVERGLALPVARLQREAARVMRMMKIYDISPERLESIFVADQQSSPAYRAKHLKNTSEETVIVKKHAQQPALFRPTAQVQTDMQFKIVHWNNSNDNHDPVPHYGERKGCLWSSWCPATYYGQKRFKRIVVHFSEHSSS